MNILKKCKMIKRGKLLSVNRKDSKIIIKNVSESENTIIITKVFKSQNKSAKINFSGKVLSGDKCGVIAKLVSKNRNAFCDIPLNSCVIAPKKANFFMIALRVKPNTVVEIEKLSIDYVEKYESDLYAQLENDAVLITPGYPSYSKKYNFSFVHSKVKMYKEMGMNVDVLAVSDVEDSEIYEFEGVRVVKTNYLLARDILQEKKYKKILVHFFKEEFANMLDAVDISNSSLYIYAHGADVIYRDFNEMTTKYFEKTKDTTNEQAIKYKHLDEIINKYNQKNNVRWIFGTNWEKQRSEETNGIKYRNYSIIPCNIDNNVFKYTQKNAENRKKIFTIKKFDNINTYSVDLVVRTILELSRRSCFDELEFNIYGDGTEFDRLLAPISNFNNVNLHRGFLTHSEIAEIHEENGIGLFPTRYETQGVSASEAAMSGLVVLSGQVAAVPEVFGNCEMLCEKENYVEYADKIEYLYNNPNRYRELSQEMHDLIYTKYSNDAVKKLESELMSGSSNMKEDIVIPEAERERLLTIAIASYNVEKYLSNGVLSLIRSKYASKLEVLIINDGSKDNTAKIGKQLEQISTINGKSIVKLVDKENGGHGSAINKGIELATGKYFKLMDGDDYFDTEALDKLLEILANSDADIVLNKYVEDLAIPSEKNAKNIYDFLVPGYVYNIEDLCYTGYGFDEWGPLLSTSTYRTKMLKDANFKISEKCFYVDMELNTYAFINAKSIAYYPLDLYIYFIGRAGQSISQASYMKNYKNHEHVILKIIDEYANNKNISEMKRFYIKNKIIIPMIKCQYMIGTVFFSNSKVFQSFDTQLKKYAEFYNIMEGRRIKMYRLTGGKMIKVMHIFDAIMRRIKR